MLREDPNFYLPNLYTFQNGNTFYGSLHQMRFRVRPVVRESEEEKETLLEVQVWYGEYCMEESEIAAQAAFPESEAGYEALLDWMDQEYRSSLDPSA